MIKFDRASVTYPGGVHALREVSLEIPDGQMMVIVGLSGAGKSTLIRAINGLVPLTGGDILVDGQSVTGASPAELRRLRSRIGMIFQTFNLVRRTTVINNVLMGRLHSTGTMRSLLPLPTTVRKLASRITADRRRLTSSLTRSPVA